MRGDELPLLHRLKGGTIQHAMTRGLLDPDLTDPAVWEDFDLELHDAFVSLPPGDLGVSGFWVSVIFGPYHWGGVAGQRMTLSPWDEACLETSTPKEVFGRRRGSFSFGLFLGRREARRNLPRWRRNRCLRFRPKGFLLLGGSRGFLSEGGDWFPLSLCRLFPRYRNARLDPCHLG